MTLDQYQLCPCGNGKKVKFCCSREFVHDLDRIQRMVQGDQRLAALEKTESLLAKYPDRPSLLMTKAEIEMQLDEPAKARDTIERLSQIDAKNPSVLAMRALLAIVLDGNLNTAINAIQDAFEAVDGVVTARMYEAIVVLANMLMRAGLPAASKGHLQLALALSDAKDENAAQALMQLNHSRQVPLVLREPFTLKQCPDNVTWRIEFETAMREVYRGRWRRGAAQLSAMAARILDEPAILFNQGVVQTWLGDNLNAVRAFSDVGRIREVPFDERVHALAIAECLDPDQQKNLIDVIEKTYELSNLDNITEKCLASTTLRQLPVNREAASDDQPLPRSIFEVLSKPLPTNLENVQPDDIPEAWGTLLFFGKETDRPARLTAQFARTKAGPMESTVRELLGELPAVPEKVVDHAPWFGMEVLAIWRVPEGLSVDQRRQLQADLRRHSVLEKWPVTPSPRLGGKTPTEAARDSTEKFTVLADLLNMEIVGQDSHWNLDFNEIRRRLDLPTREPIDATTVDLDRLPVHRFSLLDIPQLTDEELLTVYRRAYAVMAVWALRQIALEVVSRESLDDKIDKVEAFDILSDVAPTTDEALDYLSKARKLATSEGESPAAWLIDELEIRLLRGEVEKFVQLLKEIQVRYIKEPGIAQSLLGVLSRYGLVTPDGRIMIPASSESAGAEQADASAAPGGLWTPNGGDVASSSTGEGENESKLWIPGMD